MAITRLLLEAASANATENATMVSDDYEIVYASGAVMLKAVGSFMLMLITLFMK